MDSPRVTAAALAAAVLLTACGCDRNADALVQGTVIVTREEYEFFASAQKAAVYGHFAAEYGAEDKPGFWDRSYAGGSPAEMLRARTLREISSAKALLGMSRDLGLIDDISHAAFLRLLKAENMRRRTRVDSGHVVYGPVQWDAFGFFYYRQSNLELALKRAIAGDPGMTDEARLHSAWDSLRATVFADDTSRLLRITARSDAPRSSALPLMELKRRIDSAGGFRPAFLHKAQVDTASFRLPVSARDGDGEGSDVSGDALRRMRPGQAGEIVRGRGAASFTVCLERIHGSQPFALAKPTLQQLLVDAEFERRVAEAVRRTRLVLESGT